MLLIVSGLGDDGLFSIRGPINWAGHCVTFVVQAFCSCACQCLCGCSV